jgi:hypothetical protein
LIFFFDLVFLGLFRYYKVSYTLILFIFRTKLKSLEAVNINKQMSEVV